MDGDTGLEAILQFLWLQVVLKRCILDSGNWAVALISTRLGRQKRGLQDLLGSLRRVPRRGP